MKRFLSLLDRAPLYWMAVALGVVVLGLNLHRFSGGEARGATEQNYLDDAFVESLRSGDFYYGLLPDTPQTFGSHVLPQALTAAVSSITGDADRAGMWLSLVGVTGVLTGLYLVAIRIYPLRGFALATVVAAGGLAPLRDAISPFPSTALGMGLVVWGMALFLMALTDKKPHYIFASSICFGLASYIRIEFVLLNLILAFYLIQLNLFQASARRREPSALSMALGSLFTLAIVLWPLVHRNIMIAGTPLLPGHDAELILGAPSTVGGDLATPYLERFVQGLLQLTVSPSGPGIFAAILLPIGLVVGLILARHAKLPFFWIPVVLTTLVGLTALSWITGAESYLETLGMLTPVLLPFSFLPIAFVIERVLQASSRSAGVCRLCWAGVVVICLLLVQVPNFFPSLEEPSPSLDPSLVDQFAELPPRIQAASLLSDQPGVFVRGGKRNVIGTRGQTDWSILAASTSNGGFQPDQLLTYLEVQEVEVIHLADPENPLISRLELEPNAPRFEPVSGLALPHRLFSISWP